MDFYCNNFGVIILIFIKFFLGKTDFIFESSTLSQKSYLIRARDLKSNKRLTFYWFYMNNNQSSFLNAVNILIVALIDLNGINYFWTNFRHTQRYNSFCTIFKIFMVFFKWCRILSEIKLKTLNKTIKNQSDQKTRVISLVLWLEQIAHIQ